jgi:hypothetical protein
VSSLPARIWARTALGSSYIDGPVRIVAPVALEAYLIWGTWISDSRAYVIVSGHTWELHAALSLPVNLDGNAPHHTHTDVHSNRHVNGFADDYGNSYAVHLRPADRRPRVPPYARDL